MQLHVFLCFINKIRDLENNNKIQNEKLPTVSIFKILWSKKQTNVSLHLLYTKMNFFVSNSQQVRI